MTIEEVKAKLAQLRLTEKELKEIPPLGPWACWRCGNSIREDFSWTDGHGTRHFDVTACYDWLMSEGNICSWCLNVDKD